jgi:hypothetical protein
MKREQLNARVETKWKKEVSRDALELSKTKDIVVNACLRFVFSTMNREERSKLYRETPYAGLRRAAAAVIFLCSSR